MPKTKLVLISLLHALGVAAYICLVALFFRNANQIFGKVDNYFTPVAMLMLLVFSAAVTGGLTLGRSIVWYLDGRKKEALLLFFYILGWLFVLMMIVFSVLIALKNTGANIPADKNIITATFNCADNKSIQTKFYDDKVDLDISDGRHMTLPRAISASGARYANADESFVFWNKGDTAFIEEGGKLTIKDCITTED